MTYCRFRHFRMSLGSPTLVKQSNRKRSQIHRATSRGGCGQVSRSESVANRFLDMFSHYGLTTRVRPISMTSRTAVMKMHSCFYSVPIQYNSRLGPRSKLRHKLGDTIFSTITLGKRPITDATQRGVGQSRAVSGSRPV